MVLVHKSPLDTKNSISKGQAVQASVALRIPKVGLAHKVQIDVAETAHCSRRLSDHVTLEKPFKGTGNYWLLLEISINIKPYLVKSNGELLIV